MMISAAHETKTADCIAIIVAAGSGSRASSSPNGNSNQPETENNQEKHFWLEKQFWPLAGKTVLAHSVDVLKADPLVKTIIVVTSAQNLDYVKSQFGGNNFHVVQGGATRQQSVYAGQKPPQILTSRPLCCDS